MWDTDASSKNFTTCYFLHLKLLKKKSSEIIENTHGLYLEIFFQDV